MIFIGLGSNLAGDYGSSQAALTHAVQLMGAHGLRVIAASPFYQTPPLGPAGQADYINMVVQIISPKPAFAVLRLLHKIEAEMGRTRRLKWGARIIDLDLLDMNGKCQTRPHKGQPLLPHPQLHKRGFVLYPLRDIAPDWRHPQTGKSIKQLIKELPLSARQGMKRVY